MHHSLRKAVAYLAVLLTPSVLPAMDFASLVQSCVPYADLRTITAIVATESAFRPYALSINHPLSGARRFGYTSSRIYLKRQPQNRSEAERWIAELRQNGFTVSAGLMQLNLEEFSAADALNPCRNLQLGWGLLEDIYRHAVGTWRNNQISLRRALSAYNSGSFTSAPEYATSVARNAR
jgi:type IV secretion system protein VirB1